MEASATKDDDGDLRATLKHVGWEWRVWVDVGDDTSTRVQLIAERDVGMTKLMITTHGRTLAVAFDQLTLTMGTIGHHVLPVVLTLLVEALARLDAARPPEELVRLAKLGVCEHCGDDKARLTMRDDVLCDPCRETRVALEACDADR